MNHTIHCLRKEGIQGDVKLTHGLNGSKKYRFRLGIVESKPDGSPFLIEDVLTHINNNHTNTRRLSVVTFGRDNQFETIPWCLLPEYVSEFDNGFISVNGYSFRVLGMTIVWSLFDLYD